MNLCVVTGTTPVAGVGSKLPDEWRSAGFSGDFGWISWGYVGYNGRLPGALEVLTGRSTYVLFPYGLNRFPVLWG